MELEQWTPVNRELRQHGFPLVELTDPSSARDITDLVLLSSESARKLRQTLLTLMKDCDRRQELIQELIVTNNQIRDELKAQTGVTDQYELRTRDLTSILDDSRLRIQELEVEKLDLSQMSRDDTERISNTKDAAAARCDLLTHKCALFEQEVDRLQKKLKQINAEEEYRKKKQNEVLKHMRQKWVKGSATNDSILSLIDYYENELAQLRQGAAPVDDSQTDSLTGSIHSNLTAHRVDTATANYKALIKSYERQMKDSKKKMKTLENETELMKLELQSRPELTVFRDTQTKLKKLERIVKHHGLSTNYDSEKKSRLLFSTKTEDIEFLPVMQCRQYLKKACQDLKVKDIEELTLRIPKVVKDSETLPSLLQFNQEVVEIVTGHEGRRGTEHASWCDKSVTQIIPTLQGWSLQLQANKELQDSIHRLGLTILPSKHLQHYAKPQTTDLIRQVDSLTGEVDYHGDDDNKPSDKDGPTRAMLLDIVSHFQNLFDVKNVNGAYAKMSEVYSKLGEARNILRTLKTLLCLDDDCKNIVLVDCVSRLLEKKDAATREHLSTLLNTDDIDSVITKLEEYDEFFPVFNELLQTLMDTLNVQRLDRVLPAVRALKLLAGS